MEGFKPPFERRNTFLADINGFGGLDFKVEEESSVEVYRHIMDRLT